MSIHFIFCCLLREILFLMLLPRGAFPSLTFKNSDYFCVCLKESPDWHHLRALGVRKAWFGAAGDSPCQALSDLQAHREKDVTHAITN